MVEKATPKKMYICDPDANIACSRSGCALMGGTCFTTSHRDYAASDASGLPEELTMRKYLEMQALTKSAKKGTPASILIIHTDTSNIHKNKLDTLWSAIFGFGAGAVFVVAIGLILLGVLFYVKG